MNLKELKPYERAARIYCEKAGLDPNEMIPVPHATIAGAADLVPQWAMVAERMIDLSMLLTAMKEAAKAPVIQPAH